MMSVGSIKKIRLALLSVVVVVYFHGQLVEAVTAPWKAGSEKDTLLAVAKAEVQTHYGCASPPQDIKVSGKVHPENKKGKMFSYYVIIDKKIICKVYAKLLPSNDLQGAGGNPGECAKKPC